MNATYKLIDHGAQCIYSTYAPMRNCLQRAGFTIVKYSIISLDCVQMHRYLRCLMQHPLTAVLSTKSHTMQEKSEVCNSHGHILCDLWQLRVTFLLQSCKSQAVSISFHIFFDFLNLQDVKDVRKTWKLIESV